MTSDWVRVTWWDTKVCFIIDAPTIDDALHQLDRNVQRHAWGRFDWNRLVLGRQR